MHRLALVIALVLVACPRQCVGDAPAFSGRVVSLSDTQLCATLREGPTRCVELEDDTVVAPDVSEGDIVSVAFEVSGRCDAMTVRTREVRRSDWLGGPPRG